MSFLDYIRHMERYMEQALKQPYKLECMIIGTDYNVTVRGFTIKGFTATFNINHILAMSAVMSPYLAGKQILDEWREQYINSILDTSKIKLSEF